MRRIMGGLDNNALAFRRLLVDPCHADMVMPCYQGLGSGQLRRFRSLIASPTGAVEGCIIVSLATNSFWQASHVAGTQGTNYTFNPSAVLFPSTVLQATGAQSRPVAGCIKVRYTGAETARAGQLGLATVPGPFRGPGNVSTAIADLARCPVINRFGDVMHEVKFVPTTGDESFEVSAVSTVGSNNCLVVVYRGIPANSLQIETTAVYEVEVTDENMPITGVPPQSNNTLNQVLTSLGPAVNWAYGNVVAPTIKSMAGAAAAGVTGNSVYAVAKAVPLVAL